MKMMSIFVNRHHELRYIWRILLFLCLFIGLWLALLIPLARLIPGTEIPGVLVSLLVSGGVTWGMTRFVNRKPFAAIGVSIHPGFHRELGAGFGLGFLMIAGVFVAEYLLGYVAFFSRGLSVGQVFSIIGLSIALFLPAAVFEEMMFRGYLFQTLIQWITFLPATLLMALLFAGAHAANPNVTALALVNVGLAGIWLSVAYMKTRSLWLPFGLHFSWNFFQSTVFSFPVSGMHESEMNLFTVVQQGPVWVTGGAFGPEGGVLTTVALALGTWYILKSRLLVAPEGIITLDSLEDLLVRGENGSGK